MSPAKRLHFILPVSTGLMHTIFGVRKAIKSISLGLLLMSITICFTSPQKNLIMNTWECTTNDFSNSVYVINDSARLRAVLRSNQSYCDEKDLKVKSTDFSKYSILGMIQPGAGYCHAEYYRDVTYDNSSKKFIYTLVTIGIGGCRHMAVSTLQLVLVPKIYNPALVKFRYCYRSSIHNNEFSALKAKKLLKEKDDAFQIFYEK